MLLILQVVATEYRPKAPRISCPEDECFFSLIKKCWSQSPHCRPSMQQIIEELSEGYSYAMQ